ncbi:MAG: hypothetical protein RBS57_19650 [Desulforhabdus sp.]|jgi:hypothetical protein|nr:hypothetical protein [Desulforhabdus sp.]
MNIEQKGPTAPDEGGAGLINWLIVLGIAAFFFVWGLFVFFAVGDKGPPSWHFGVVQDIPGESKYTEYGPTFVPGEGKVVPPQHVDRETSKPYGIKKGAN